MHYFHSLLLMAAISIAIPTPSPTMTHGLRGLASSSHAATGDFTITENIVIPGETNSVLTMAGETIHIAVPTCVQTTTPDQNGYVPPGTCGAIWAYYPSFSAAVAMAVLFSALVVVHIWQAAYFKKTWCWVIIMASIWEAAAMSFRAISSKYQQNDGIYLVFQIFILLAPLWVNAFVYMTFGRIVHYFHPSQSVLGIRAPLIGAIFVVLDIVSFIVQLAGGSMVSPDAKPETQRRGLNIYMGGIGFQQGVIVLFVGLCTVFHGQMWKQRPPSSPWGPLLWNIYFALSMITTRIIYRLNEFSSGANNNDPLTTKEVYFYMLEAVPMLLALTALAVIHPGRAMKGAKGVMPGAFTLLKAACLKHHRMRLIPDEESVNEHEMDTRMGQLLPRGEGLAR